MTGAGREQPGAGAVTRPQPHLHNSINIVIRVGRNILYKTSEKTFHHHFCDLKSTMEVWLLVKFFYENVPPAISIFEEFRPPDSRLFNISTSPRQTGHKADPW